MASSYPGALDSFSAPGASLAGPPTHENLHLDVNDAVVAIQTELGTNPRDRISYSYADTTARDAAITSPVAGNIAYLEDIDRHTVYDGSAWIDPVDDWRAVDGEVSETGLTDSWTTTAAFADYGSAQTFTKPTAWTTYDLIVVGQAEFVLSPQDQFYFAVRMGESGTYGQPHYTTVDNWRTGASTTFTMPIGPARFTGLSGNASLRPNIRIAETAGTSPQIDAVRWDVEIVAVRVT